MPQPTTLALLKTVDEDNYKSSIMKAKTRRKCRVFNI